MTYKSTMAKRCRWMAEQWENHPARMMTLTLVVGLVQAALYDLAEALTKKWDR